MTPLFIYGTLCHLPLLQAVLGRMPKVQQAALANYAVFWADGHDFPLPVAEDGAEAKGLLLADLTAEDMARLDYYEGPFGYDTHNCSVTTDQGAQSAQVYLPQAGLWTAGAAWSLQDWAARCGETVVLTAGDVMALYPAPIAPLRRGPMLVRGGSRMRAGQTVASPPRHNAAAADVTVHKRHQPYSDFFSVEEYHLSFRRFDGAPSPIVKRAAFVSGDAVTVLPYDPVRDRVLLVEQFRVAPFVRGDSQPWQLEAIAGRIDPFETPETTARRESVEEAGLTLGALLPVGSFYPSPGAKTEYVYSYIAIADLPDSAAIIGGEPSEAEDIKGHILDFADFAALVANGTVATAPLLISFYWLQRERARIRSDAAYTQK
jgi:ADP-ribose pyrophosphatase